MSSENERLTSALTLPAWAEAHMRYRECVKCLFERVGLYHRLDCKPAQLSGGQQQRAAIVRALANRPKLILADEPTGNLDSENGALVFDLLTEPNSKLGTSSVLVTHDDELAKRAQRIICMTDGSIAADYEVAALEREAAEAGRTM